MKIGIDIGGSHIAVGLVDGNNKIVSKKEHDWTEEEKKELFKSVEVYAKKFIKQFCDENNQIQKIGIGFPAQNIINGVINKSGKTIKLTEILTKEFNIPVYLKNDVKCSGLCEKNIGALKEYNNCFFITLGTGIGGAYFYKNELVVPNKFHGFEVGHMIIESKGKACKCGQHGCFEQYASMRVFRKDIEELFNIEKLTSYKMFEILEKKEKQEEVNVIIEKYIDYLSIGLINIINIFEPDAICIGGSFTYYAPIFMGKLKQKIKENFKNREVPEMLTAKYENDAGIIGASMLDAN